MVDWIFLLATAFGDSDDGDDDPDEDVQDNRDENHDVDGPDSMDEPSPPASNERPSSRYSMPRSR